MIFGIGLVLATVIWLALMVIFFRDAIKEPTKKDRDEVAVGGCLISTAVAASVLVISIGLFLMGVGR